MDPEFFEAEIIRITDVPKINEWYEIHVSELTETEYAANNGLESTYWCWMCRFSECEYHN